MAADWLFPSATSKGESCLVRPAAPALLGLVASPLRTSISIVVAHQHDEVAFLRTERCRHAAVIFGIFTAPVAMCWFLMVARRPLWGHQMQAIADRLANEVPSQRASGAVIWHLRHPTVGCAPAGAPSPTPIQHAAVILTIPYHHLARCPSRESLVTDLATWTDEGENPHSITPCCASLEGEGPK